MPSARDNWIVFDLLNEYRLTGIAFQGFDNQQMPKNWLLESGSERISQSLCFCLLSLSLLSLSLSLPIPLLFFCFFLLFSLSLCAFLPPSPLSFFIFFVLTVCPVCVVCQVQVKRVRGRPSQWECALRMWTTMSLTTEISSRSALSHFVSSLFLSLFLSLFFFSVSLSFSLLLTAFL